MSASSDTDGGESSFDSSKKGDSIGGNIATPIEGTPIESLMEMAMSERASPVRSAYHCELTMSASPQRIRKRDAGDEGGAGGDAEVGGIAWRSVPPPAAHRNWAVIAQNPTPYTFKPSTHEPLH